MKIQYPMINKGKSETSKCAFVLSYPSFNIGYGLLDIEYFF